MESDFWMKKWQDGDIRFHQASFHPQLVQFGERITAPTVLVPLCGKSLDMLYFAARGQQVIGVELSPMACEDFFRENKIVYQHEKVSGFVVYRSERITLWCGDFFQLPQNVWSSVGAVYDRAALVALPLEMRQRYTRELVSRTRGALQMLLIAYQYPQEQMAGPPFSVSSAEVHTHYQGLQIHTLHTREEQLRTLAATETVYWVERIE